METIDNNSDEKYSECLTTYDQILDAAGFLTSEIDRRRRDIAAGSSKADLFIELYNKALDRFIKFVSTVEIRISEIKGFKKFFIGYGEQKDIPYYTVYIRRTYADSCINNKIDEGNGMMTAISLEYYNEANVYSNRARHKPILYDILYYIK